MNDLKRSSEKRRSDVKGVGTKGFGAALLSGAAEVDRLIDDLGSGQPSAARSPRFCAGDVFLAYLYSGHDVMVLFGKKVSDLDDTHCCNVISNYKKWA